jgi:uncharacterized membrane protein YoaT (DUF817 family)
MPTIEADRAKLEMGESSHTPMWAVIVPFVLFALLQFAELFSLQHLASMRWLFLAIAAMLFSRAWFIEPLSREVLRLRRELDELKASASSAPRQTEGG